MTVHDEQAVRSAIAKTVEEFIRDATPSTAVAKIASFITFESSDEPQGKSLAGLYAVGSPEEICTA
jgi:hypothetical protein